jgi:hypothetical protein
MPGVLQGKPLLSAVYEYCATRRGGRAMPRRADIDPVDLPRFVLPQLMLLDVFEGGARFRWRLAGTEVVNRFGRDATGHFDEEVLSGKYLAFFSSLIHHVCRCQVPVYSHAVFSWEQGRSMTSGRLLVPLGDEATGVTQILGAHDFGAKSALSHNPAELLRDAQEIEELVREELPFDAPC